MLPNALWGLAMPTLQSLMTRRVGESEPGQLQGANMSVASVAGVASPLFFGWIYSVSVGEGFEPVSAWLRGVGVDVGLASRIVDALSTPGLAFYLAAVVLGLAALIGWITARRAERDEVTLV
jgi:DHA1 family tetracycline resistance protein-like MFS transporter